MKVKIEKLVFEGYGFGHLEDGRPVFVHKSVPGDELEIELIENKKNYAKGRIVEIIKPSEIRIAPKCPNFESCGGCEHQNIGYTNQLELKEKVFKEILERQRLNIKPEPIIPGSNSEFYYRNSIRFFFKDTSEGVKFARHNYLYKNGLVEVDKCYLQSLITNDILKTLKNFLNNDLSIKKSMWQFWQLKIREGKSTKEIMVEIITTSIDLPAKEGIINTLKQFEEIKSIYHTIAPNKSLKNLERHLIYGSPIIHEKIGKYTFQISPESFFQTNSLGVENLYNHIKSYADVQIGETVLDLFCGTGTIGIYLSFLAKKIIGIESVKEAINDARDNARINKIQNCEFICADAEKWLRENYLKFKNYKLKIVLDPPRAGLSKSIIRLLAKYYILDAQCKLIYVSCNPATFARDIREFKKYDIVLQKVQPVDMFPQTHHVECIGLLKQACRITPTGPDLDHEHNLNCLARPAKDK